MRNALRGRGTRHDDLRDRLDRLDRLGHRTEPVHMTLRTQPHPFG
jgi:hypothetical protein